MNKRKQLFERHEEEQAPILQMERLIPSPFSEDDVRAEPRQKLQEAIDKMRHAICTHYLHKTHLDALAKKLDDLIEEYSIITGGERELQIGESDGRIPQEAMDELRALARKFREQTK